MASTVNKTCFVIGPISKPASPQRKRSDELMDKFIIPVLKPFGYEITRADKITGPGEIMRLIPKMLNECDLVIADLTDRNPNVLYELGVRHAWQKPCVPVIGINEEIPFDQLPIRVIQIDIESDNVDVIVKTRSEITDYVQAITSDQSKIISPISNYMNDRQKPRRSVDCLVHLRRWTAKSNLCEAPFEHRKIGMFEPKIDANIYNEAVVYRHFAFDRFGEAKVNRNGELVFDSQLVSSGLIELEGGSHSQDSVHVVPSTYQTSYGRTVDYSVIVEPDDRCVIVRQRIHYDFLPGKQYWDVKGEPAGAVKANLYVDFGSVLKHATFSDGPRGYYMDDLLEYDARRARKTIPITKVGENDVWMISYDNLPPSSRIRMEWEFASS